VYANNDGQVYIINHDTTRGGFNVILDAMFSYWESKKSKSVSQRVPNDALRTAAILLDPDNRGTVSIIMSNKNDQKRAHIDQATCPIQAFFNKAAADFTNVSYVAKSPAKQNLIEGHESFDPNDVDRITLSGRDGEWFRKTWETYIRPKFRKALGKWFSETGGGDGTIQSFQNFCGNEKWLCSIYMLDAENGFLLASNSNPKVPAELDNESGFYKDGAVPTTPEKSNATNKSKIQSMIDKTDKQLEGFATLQDTIVKMLESRTNPALAAAAPAAVASAAKDAL
jgi:hypothetical protein